MHAQIYIRNMYIYGIYVLFNEQIKKIQPLLSNTKMWLLPYTPLASFKHKTKYFDKETLKVTMNSKKVSIFMGRKHTEGLIDKA